MTRRRTIVRAAETIDELGDEGQRIVVTQRLHMAGYRPLGDTSRGDIAVEVEPADGRLDPTARPVDERTPEPVPPERSVDAIGKRRRHEHRRRQPQLGENRPCYLEELVYVSLNVIATLPCGRSTSPLEAASSSSEEMTQNSERNICICSWNPSGVADRSDGSSARSRCRLEPMRYMNTGTTKGGEGRRRWSISPSRSIAPVRASRRTKGFVVTIAPQPPRS